MPELTLQEYTLEIEGMLERNAHTEAVAHSQHILKQHPKYVEPYRLIGQAAFDRDDHQLAADMFTRILSANPSDFVSRAGLAVVYDKQGSLKDAVWQMERAFEIQPGNAAIQEELRQLYGRRDGVTPDKVPLTRGALARLYLNGELYSEAVAELRALLAVESDRVDLQALLAEALWRDEQRLEASDVALKVLDQMPYCLDANLILGEIWMNGGREEDAEVHLKRALALDPEGKRATELFGKASPIPPRPVEIPLLDYAPPAAAPVIEEAPQWLSGFTPGEAAAPSEEIPTWLQGIGLPGVGETAQAQAAVEEFAAPSETGEEIPAWLTGLGAAAPAAAAVAELPEIEEEAPDWLAQLRQTAEAPVEAAAPEEAPDWLSALGSAGVGQPALAEEAEAAPDWLSQLRQAAPASEEAVAEPEAAAPGVPDWLRALQPEGFEQPEAPSAEEQPEWLAQLHEQVGTLPGFEEEVAPAEAIAAPEAAELPDWLRALKPEGVEETVPAAEPSVPEWLTPIPEEAQSTEMMPVELAAPVAEETPAWTAEGAGMPSPDEAMAFFQRLTAGKEAELQAQAQAEADARMAEIMGKAAPAPAPKPEPVTPSLPPVAQPPAPPQVEAVAPPTEGAMPSPDEAMAFFQRLTAGKEAELQAQAQAEADARMAEIMGKAAPAPKAESAPAKPTPPVAKPTPPPAPKPEPVAPPKVEPVAVPTEGAMPSPDEAMAFFQRLTAGKETELKAQAEAEAEVRMAEIMGKAAPAPKAEPAPTKPTPAPKAQPVPAKPTPPPAPKPESVLAKPTPVAPPPVVKPPAPPQAEAAALPTEGAMPSPDEAMAFFQRLTAGKEVELKAQAEAEADARMVAIMGRAAPAPVKPPEALVEPPPSEAVEEAVAPAFPTSVPEWLAGAPTIEVPAPEEITQEIPSGWEAIMQPPPIETWPAEAPLAAPELEIAAPWVAGWPVPQVLPPTMVAVAPVKHGTGPLGAARQPVKDVSGPDWWYQTLEDEEGTAPEAPAEGELAVPLTEVMAVQEIKPAPAPAPAPTPPPPTPAARLSKRLERAKPKPATPPKPIVDLDAIMARLRANPDDPQALLDLARGQRQMDNMSAARASYDELIRRGVVLDDVISDLDNIIEDRHDDVDSIRLLGDAHMKAGNLQKALKLYRQALKRL